MSSIKNRIIEHNKLNKLIFKEETHKYFVNGKEFISVTTKKQKYFPFKVNEVSRTVAERNWTTEDEVKEGWTIIAKNGSYIHELADRYCRKEKLNSEEINKIQHVKKFFGEHPEFEIVASEIQIFSSKYKVAGTIDLILRNTTNNRLYTIDWKTSSKDINKNDIWEMAKTPFKTIPNNKFYQYSLQLWAYNTILKEEYGIQVWDSLIIHLKNDFVSYVEIEPAQMIYEAEKLLMI